MIKNININEISKYNLNSNIFRKSSFHERTCTGSRFRDLPLFLYHEIILYMYIYNSVNVKYTF